MGERRRLYDVNLVREMPVNTWPQPVHHDPIDFYIDHSIISYEDYLESSMYRFAERTTTLGFELEFRRTWRAFDSTRCAKIARGTGCSTTVGFQYDATWGGVMTLNPHGCMTRKITDHEAGHLVCLNHMHEIENRDDYIRMIPENIDDAYRNQLGKTRIILSRATNSHVLDFDYPVIYEPTYSHKSSLHYTPIECGIRLNGILQPTFRMRTWYLEHLGVPPGGHVIFSNEKIGASDCREMNSMYFP